MTEYLTRAERRRCPTARELDCLRLSYRGLTYREVGECLGISHETVANHLRRVRIRLRAHTTREAVWLAIRAGLLSDAERIAG